MRKLNTYIGSEDLVNVILSWEDTQEAMNFQLDEAERLGLCECKMNCGSFTALFAKEGEEGQEKEWHVGFRSKSGGAWLRDSDWTEDMFNETVLICLALKKRRGML